MDASVKLFRVHNFLSFPTSRFANNQVQDGGRSSDGPEKPHVQQVLQIKEEKERGYFLFLHEFQEY